MAFFVREHGDDEGLVGTIVAVAVGGLFSVLGGYMLYLPQRQQFDRDTERWTSSRLLRSTSRPLIDILAVQLLKGGRHKCDEGGFKSYQLNLVLDDAAEPRRCLSNHANLNGTREDAERLSDFLGVPLLDHM